MMKMKTEQLNKEKIMNMKKVTAAVVIIDKDGKILACHGYGRPGDSGYDFPKGCVEEGETDKEGAIRELREETYLTIDDSKLIDAGVHRHNKEKNIHIFIYKVDEFPKLSSLKCTSYFEGKDGKMYPEVDSFAIIDKEHRKAFNKVLWDKFEIIDSLNTQNNGRI